MVNRRNMMKIAGGALMFPLASLTPKKTIAKNITWYDYDFYKSSYGTSVKAYLSSHEINIEKDIEPGHWLKRNIDGVDVYWVNLSEPLKVDMGNHLKPTDTGNPFKIMNDIVIDSLSVYDGSINKLLLMEKKRCNDIYNKEIFIAQINNNERYNIFSLRKWRPLND